jgi:hypothetical protein
MLHTWQYPIGGYKTPILQSDQIQGLLNNKMTSKHALIRLLNNKMTSKHALIRLSC